MTRKDDWRCANCGTVLGKREPGKLALKYKGVYYEVDGQGRVTAKCRNCKRPSEARAT
jgi:hypothetical protein